MRVQDAPYLPTNVDALVRQLTDLHRQIGVQLNQLSEGQIQAVTNAATAAPTGAVVSYQVGDFIRNSAPAELGVPGAKYVIFGWLATVAGAPGTWVECRFLTGA
jgi:hypothetical protein